MPTPLSPPGPNEPLAPDRHDPDHPHRVFLREMQGNILRPHGRDATWLVLFRFHGRKSRRRDFFSHALDEKLITSAEQQWLDAREAEDGSESQPFFSLAITAAGVQAAGIAWTRLPVGNMGDEFRQSMRKGFGRLGDTTVAKKGRRIPDWDLHYIVQPHGVWLLAHSSVEELEAMKTRVENFLHRHGAHITEVEKGRRWRDKEQPKLSREPFGFVDGISQPEFFAGEAFNRMVPSIKIPWTQVVIDAPGNQTHRGSFLVLRKLDQNVQRFREMEAVIAPLVAGRVREPGAAIIGRERDGTPLAEISGPAGDSNAFNFGPGAGRCPFHAHIRKANPREGSGISLQEARDAQFVRRSCVYDPAGQLPSTASAHYRERPGDYPVGNVGLLFMGYMGSLDPFLTMQANWFGDPQFPTADTGLHDPLLRPSPRWAWGQPTEDSPAMPLCVKPRGGAYFFVPSIDWLRTNGSAGQPVPPP